MENLSRRSFLKILGIAGIVVATPKIIFDVGKNLSKPILFQGFDDSIVYDVDGYSYIRASEDILSYSAVKIGDARVGSLLTTASSIDRPTRIGVAQNDIKRGDYGWIFTGGGPVLMSINATQKRENILC